jgi:hypothetical protein
MPIMIPDPVAQLTDNWKYLNCIFVCARLHNNLALGSFAAKIHIKGTNDSNHKGFPTNFQN